MMLQRISIQIFSISKQKKLKHIVSAFLQMREKGLEPSLPTET